MEIARTAALIIATLTVGLFAGVFAIYANAIMPGLRRTDDRTFVGAFQAIDTAIINPLFLMTFLGGLVFTGIAAALHLGEDFRAVLPWIVVALVLYLAVVVITVAVTYRSTTVSRLLGSPIALLISLGCGNSSTKQGGSVGICSGHLRRPLRSGVLHGPSCFWAASDHRVVLSADERPTAFFESPSVLSVQTVPASVYWFQSTSVVGG